MTDVETITKTSIDVLVRKRLRSVDLLRGIAVFAVVLMHIPHDAPGGWRNNPWLIPAFLMDFGYLGVPLFVLISGFCIHRRAAIAACQSDDWKPDWMAFWKRRFWRLYPPYLAAILFSVFTAVCLHARHPDVLHNIEWDLATHVLMAHNLTEKYAGGLGNAAFWSLGMEEQLYALYAVLLILLRRPKAITIVAVVTVLWRLILPVLSNSEFRIGSLQLGSWGLWPFGYWMHWTLGAIAVDGFFGNRSLPHWTESGKWACVCLISGMSLNHATFDLLSSTSLGSLVPIRLPESAVMTMHSLGELVVAIGCFCLMRCVIKLEDTPMLDCFLAGLVCQLGKISYSVYLTHMPVIYVLANWTSFGNTGLGWPVRCLLFSGISVAVGSLFYQAVERWFLDGRCPAFCVHRVTLSPTEKP